MHSCPKQTSWVTLCHCVQKHIRAALRKDKSVVMGKRGRWWGLEGNRVTCVLVCMCACCLLVYECESCQPPLAYKQMRSLSCSHTRGQKDLWEGARWKISVALHYSETWAATWLKRKGEKLVISTCSLWTWPDERQATQSKRFQRGAHWRLLRILMQCGIQFLWEPRGLCKKVNYL